MGFEPVIFGGYVNGYSLARTFYETYNINSVICDMRKNIACNSIFCDYHIVPNPSINELEFINEVSRIGQSIYFKGEIPILLVTNDIWLIPLAKHKSSLEKIYKYSFSGWEVIRLLVNKNHLYELSESLGVLYPKTVRYNKCSSRIQHLIPPLLVKPSNVPEYTSFFPNLKRNHIFLSHKETEDFLEKVYSKGYNDDIIIQEYIPGGVENLYTCTTYSDTGGKVKGVSVGCKLSQYPEDAGTITSGLVKYNNEVVKLTRILLESQKFFGIANTEFKFDKRDNTFKLMEINARPGMWNYSTVMSGVNLIKMLVDDVVYNKEILFSEGKDGLVWSRINKRELLNHIKNTQNEFTVYEMIKRNRVIDPLKNNKEKLAYNVDLFLLNARSKLAKIYRKFLKGRIGN